MRFVLASMKLHISSIISSGNLKVFSENIFKDFKQAKMLYYFYQSSFRAIYESHPDYVLVFVIHTLHFLIILSNVQEVVSIVVHAWRPLKKKTMNIAFKKKVYMSTHTRTPRQATCSRLTFVQQSTYTEVLGHLVSMNRLE